MLKLKSRPRTSLVDDVVVRIRELIERRHLAAGERLPSEAELIERLGVSRTVLREAVSRLETMGLVTVQRGRGTYVGDRSALTNCVNLLRTAMAISPVEIETVHEFRRALECEAARRAAQLASDADLAELAALCEQIDADGIPEVEAVRRDFRFHLKIAEITGNELMRNVMEVIQGYALAGMIQTTPVPRDRDLSQAIHRDVVEAIRTRDPEAAEAAMRRHMDYTAAMLHRRAEEQEHAQA